MYKSTYHHIYIYTHIYIYNPMIHTFFFAECYICMRNPIIFSEGIQGLGDGSITKSTQRVDVWNVPSLSEMNGFDALTVCLCMLMVCIWNDMVWLKNYLHRSIGSLSNYLQGVNTSQVVRNVSVAISKMLPLMPKKMTRFSPGEAW